MIFLVLTLAIAGQVPSPCEHFLEATFCNGPGRKPGTQCQWDASEARCRGVKKDTPTCESTIPATKCATMEKCYWDLAAGQCKEVPAGGAMVPAGYPVHKSTHKPVPASTRPATRAPTHPASPATAGPTYPSYPSGNGAYPGWPYPYPSMPAVPAYPAYPGPPGQMPMYPGYPNQVPGYPMQSTIIPSIPGYPNTYPGSQTPPRVNMQTSPMPGQDCKSLKQQMCFGPATLPEQVCYWDAEDEGECYAGLKGDVEALCAQFANSRQDCDAQLECFYDAQEQECSEVEITNSDSIPAYDAICESHLTVDKCAGESDCFFEDGICVNLIQARNICGVLFTPQLCSTNSGCVWQNNMCQISAPRLRQPYREMDTGGDFVSKGVEGMIYLLAGIMVGILLTFIYSWICAKRIPSSHIALDLDYYSRHNGVVV